MKTINIVGENGKLTIEINRYERSTSKDVDDANWLNCTVYIDVPPFSGRYDASFSTRDFLTFGQELGVLSDHLSGQATFETDEGALRLRLVMGTRGEMMIEGEAEIRASARAALKFTLQADQSYLAELRRSVMAVSTEFPVRTSRGDGRR